MSEVHVVGAGLAGSEAAWQLAERGHRVVLHEMRGLRGTDAHHTDKCAELVCSNSFRSDDSELNAVGLIHEEMRRCGSLIMRCADANKVPAGSALAVDREGFSALVTEELANHPNITLVRDEVKDLPPAEWGPTVIATGPLTADALAGSIGAATGEDALAFFDAIAPIVHFDTIDFDKAWFQSRYDKVGPDGDGKDYINCPLDEHEYHAFIDALLEGEKTEFKEWEGTPYFDGCLPIEVMAERGRETLRYGPLKPVGLTNPHAPTVKPYAIIQLRQDNKLGTLYNMVGFQTKLTYGEQVRIFRTIPGLENAEFARLGGMHRNTFLNSPQLLDETLRLRTHPHLRFAGQMTGCEGYVESAAVGLMAGRFVSEELTDGAPNRPPATTALGALLEHITGGHLSGSEDGKRSFQPMNVNFGLFPQLPEGAVRRPEGHVGRWRGKDKGLAKKRATTARALRDLETWIERDADFVEAAE